MRIRPAASLRILLKIILTVLYVKEQRKK